MSTPHPSPRVAEFQWGSVVVGKRRYRDAILYPGGAREWDWNDTGTKHSPGIQPADVQLLIDRGAEVIILSKGVHERLEVMDETLRLLDDHNIEYEILQSERAIERYNELAGERPVGALIHSTC